MRHFLMPVSSQVAAAGLVIGYGQILPDQPTSSPDADLDISSRRTSSKSLMVDASSVVEAAADLAPLPRFI